MDTEITGMWTPVYPEGETTFVNASICTASYQPTQAAIVVEL
jgi:hypothetical protein